MATIPWHDLKGDRAESFISIMLLRDFPDGRRRRPVQGDGGIDVIVPVADNPPRYDIYQIKSFFPKLESGHKSKIKGSAKKLLKTIAETGIAVERWHLVVPIDPSEDDEKWLEKIFKGTNIACFWKGWTHLEGLAAKYRDVVDYYVHDGQDRLLGMLDRAFSTVDLKRRNSENASVSVSDTYDLVLPLFEQLNIDDPHFLYNLSFLHGPFDPSSVPDSVVMSQFMGPAEGPIMRIDVYLKYALALEDRPIKNSLSFDVPDTEPELQAAVRDFDVYGEDLVVPASYASGTFNDPLSGTATYDALEVHIWSPERPRPARVRVIAADRSGRRLGSCLFTVHKISEGPSGKGFTARMVSDSGMIRITQRAKLVREDTYSGNFNIAVDLSQPRLAVQVRDELRFLRELTAPNKMVFAQEFTGPYSDVAELEDVPAPVVPKWLAAYADALSELQEFADVPLEIGYPSEHLADNLQHVKEALSVAELARGGSVNLQGSPDLLVHLPEVEPQDACDRIANSNELVVRCPFQRRIANGMVTFPSTLQTAQGVTGRIQHLGDGTPVVAIAGIEGPVEVAVKLDQ